MWNMKRIIIPVIIGATRVVTKRFKETFGSHGRKTFNRFTARDSYTRNITHYKQGTAARNLKPEQWGSPLVQEKKCQGEKACDETERDDDDDNNNNNNHHHHHSEQ
jgi:hypothetical protein